jgi:hypothetical protein
MPKLEVRREPALLTAIPRNKEDTKPEQAGAIPFEKELLPMSALLSSVSQHGLLRFQAPESK